MRIAHPNRSVNHSSSAISWEVLVMSQGLSMQDLALLASLRIVLHIVVHCPTACCGPHWHYLYLLSHFTPLTHTMLLGVSFNSPGLIHKTVYWSFPLEPYSNSLHIHSGLAIVSIINHITYYSPSHSHSLRSTLVGMIRLFEHPKVHFLFHLSWMTHYVSFLLTESLN